VAIQEIFKSGFFEKLVIKMNAPKLNNKTNFFRLLAVSQKAGLWIMDSLGSLEKSEENRWLRIIIKDLMNQLSQWVSLADAMWYHDYFFNVDDVELVRSSQITGNLVETLYDIADELETTARINQKVSKALTYPIMLLSISLVSVILLVVFAIPSIVSIFPIDSIPPITQFMLDMSAFFQSYWIIVIIVLFSLIVWYKFLYSKVLPFKIFIDKMLVHMPVVSWVIKATYMYKFSRLLSQFYSAGVNPVMSLQLISNIFTNFEYKKKTIEIKKDIETGFTFFESMEWTDLFDPILVQIIHVGEETWTITEVLSKISWFYKEQLQNKIDIMMSFLEPVLMIFIAAMVWTIVAAVFIPMASIVEVL